MKYVKYGVSTVFIYVITCTVVCSLVSSGIFLPYMYIIGFVIIAFISYFNSYRRYKANNIEKKEFKRAVIVDPSVMTFLFPVSFLFVSPGIFDFTAIFIYCLALGPFIMTNKKMSGNPEKTWGELKTVTEKIVYVILYSIGFLLCLITVISITNRLIGLINNLMQ